MGVISMKKQFKVGVVAVMSMCLLAGCGSVSGTSASLDTTSKKTLSQKEVTLHIVHWNQLGQEVIKKFEKDNPGIKIQFEQFPVDDFIQVIKTRIAAGEVPDILGAQETDFQNYIKQGIFMDLTEENFLENYYDLAVEELKDFSGDGKVYAIPTNAFSLGVWVNKDMFKDNGIEIPSNYEELKKVAEAFEAKGIAPFVQGAKDGWPLQQGMYPMFEAQVKNPDVYEKCKTGETKWTDDVIFNAVKEWSNFFAKKGTFLDGTLGLTYEQAYQTFEQGLVPMWPMGSYATEFFKGENSITKDYPFDVDFIPIYTKDNEGKDVIPGTYIGAMYAISATTQNAEAAKTFISWLTQPENAALYAKGNGVLFPVKDMDFASVVPFGNQVAKTTLDNQLVRPFNMTVDAAIESRLSVMLQGLLAGNSVDVEMEEMQKIQERVNAERK